MGTHLYVCVFAYLSVTAVVTGDTYSVNILTEQHVNLVDSKFLSFSVDPKYLFSTSEKSKECVCMVSSLAPAYIRIAGPSTAHLSFQNTTLSINDIDFDIAENDLDVAVLDADTPKKVPIDVKTVKLDVTHREWRKFIHWAKSTGFDLVFALNNEERTPSGMWDPNTALNILTVAEKVKVGDIFWELGYECRNQSIEEYLNDLETLRVIIETFPPGRTGEWKVVAGDVTKCLQADSKSDFKDYIMLSNEMMDALLLNGNSTYQELEHMSDLNRMKLLRLFAHSKTPLWITETNQIRYNQLERAADWLSSLGYAAKNGFSVHYRELEEEEMYEPTLSFYMALLFKNLVGERVLDIGMVPKEAILFGHCTSLRQKPVPGAVTLFGVNMDEEPARFSLKLSKREEGGDILQFILGYDHSGNIIVNGRPMFYEGDIKPVVKHVRPFKTLLITLPAKSFGFWVLANTKIEACQNTDGSNKTITVQTATEHLKVKRSVGDDFEDYSYIANLSYDKEDTDTNIIDNKALRNRIDDINRDILKIHGKFQSNNDRFKRDDLDQHFAKLKSRRPRLKHKIVRNNLDFDPKGILHDILQKAKQSVDVIKNKGTREVKRILNKNRLNKRHSKTFRVNSLKKPARYFNAHSYEKMSRKRAKMGNVKSKHMPKRVTSVTELNRNQLNDELLINYIGKAPNISAKPKKMKTSEDKNQIKNSIENEITKDETNILRPNVRKRRYVTTETEELLTENDLKSNEKNKKSKVRKNMKNVHKNSHDFSYEIYDEDSNDSQEGILFKTELSDDGAIIKMKDTGKGLIHSTMNNMVNVLEDLNRNLNRFWSALSTLG